MLCCIKGAFRPLWQSWQTVHPDNIYRTGERKKNHGRNHKSALQLCCYSNDGGQISFPLTRHKGMMMEEIFELLKILAALVLFVSVCAFLLWISDFLDTTDF